MNYGSPEADPNWIEYQRLLASPEWRQSYQGKLVAFFDGKLVAFAETSEQLIINLKEGGLGEVACMIVRAGDDKVIDIPTFHLL
jgi:hypothetical protein